MIHSFIKRFATYIVAVVLLMPAVLYSCQERENSPKTSKPKRTPETIDKLAALPTAAPSPEDNPLTPEKIELGRLLFFDPILSGNKDVACATCHHPDFGFSDGQEISIGVNASGLGSHRSFNTPNDIPFVKRNSQSVLNTAFNGIAINFSPQPSAAPMFWDLRVESLEKQSLEPIKALEEMRGHVYPIEKALATVTERLTKIPAYQTLFSKAFPGKDPITTENMAKAIANYERTILSNNSRFDQYMRGDKSALSSYELEGLAAFLKSGCAQCHNGPMFSDFKVHTIGVPDNEKNSVSDSGVNKQYGFRTASLRNLAFTFPYMHSGKFGSLQQVLEFYEDLGNGKIANPNVTTATIDPLTKNIAVDFKNIKLIVDFLNTLNDSYDKTVPAKVPSGLQVGGNIR